MMLHMKVCNKRYLFMLFKSLYSIKKLSGKKAFGTYDKSFCMNFWDLSVEYTIKGPQYFHRPQSYLYR